MKSNTKSSITLPPSELDLVNHLMKALKVKTKVEVIRRGLTLLKETIDRKSLQDSFRHASKITRDSVKEEIRELDSLSGEGLE